MQTFGSSFEAVFPILEISTWSLVVGRKRRQALCREKSSFKPLLDDPSKSLDERTSTCYGKPHSRQLSLEGYLVASSVVAPNACIMGGQEETEGRWQGPKGGAADVTASPERRFFVNRNIYIIIII